MKNGGFCKFWDDSSNEVTYLSRLIHRRTTMPLLGKSQDAREFKRLQKARLKAQSNNNTKEEAEICNQLGELLAKHGEYEEAIEEHRNELHLSDSIGDILGTAIAHRKIGECLSSLDRFEDAVKHQKSHLRLARSLANHVEEQRALATLGRTYLLQADSLTGTEGATAALIKAQQAFLKSLDVCDLLRDVVPVSDYNEMRARLFLNLGIVLDNKGDDSGEWRAFIKKCIFICEKHKLLEDLYRAHYTLGDIYQRRGYPAQALRSVEAALQCAKKMKDKFIESECLASTAQIHFHLGDWSAAKRALRKAYKLGSLLDKDRHRIISCLRTAIKGCQLLHELGELGEEDHQGRMCVYEKLGDTSSDLGLYSKAVEYYNKQLSCATQLQKPARQMAVIHYSLAASYADMKEFGKAVDHYRQELQYRKGNVKEECKTLLLLAQALEDDGSGYSQLATIYQQALQAARQTNSDKLKIRVLKHFCIVQEQFGVDGADLREELSCVRDESGVASGDESSDEEAESDRGGSESVEEVDLSASDDSENEEYDRGTTGRARKGWMNRKNEKGESMLHRACIDGNLKLVKSLVEQGHPVNPRDYSGWLPLHEACNHGYLDIVEYLVDHSAAMNDRGGEHCEGITPLHDAAICGHGDIVQLLVSKGANVLAKDDEGRTPLDAMVSWRQSYEKELDEEALNLALRTERVLRTAMKEGNPTVAPLRSRAALHDDLFDDEDTESANPELAVPQQVTRRQPPSREGTNSNRRKETGRTLQRSRPQGQKQRVDKRSHVFGFVESDDSEGSNDVDSYSGRSLSQSQPVSDIDTFQSFSGNSTAISSQVPREEEYEDDFVELRPARTKQRNRVVRPRVVNDHGLEEERFGSQLEPEVHLGQNLHEETDTVSLLDDPTNVYQQAMASVGRSAVRRELSQRPRDQEESVPNHTPALINEEDYTGGDDWLVDDVVQRPAKRQKLSCDFSEGNQTRSISSRKPSTGSGGGEVSSDAGVASRTQTRGGSSSRTTGRNRLSRPKRQTQLTLTGMGVRQQDRRQESNMVDLTEESQVFQGSASREDAVVPTPQVHSATAAQVPMRLRVKVQDKTFLIPIPNSDSSKSIAWLAEQASQRYYNMCGLRPRLALHTREGAMLEAHDAISDVLSTNEEVVASVQSWDLPPLPERYIKACENSNSAVHPRVRALCESQQSSASLSASSLGLRLPSLSPLLSALQCQYCIKTLVLAGNRIGDKGAHLLASAVVTLPSLVQLDISCTGLTHAGLTTMAEVLGGDQGTTGQQNMALQSGKPLQHLEVLNLGFNPLGDSCTLPLARLVQACPLLTVLQLQSCCLSMKVFQQHRKQLMDGLKGALHLQTLDMSHNPLGSTGVELLLKCLAQDVVTSLDLCGVIATSSNNHLARHVSLYLAQPDCVLKHLSLADNYLCDDMLGEITRALQSNPTLQSLQVSTNCKLGNQTLQTILETVQSGVPLQELDMSGCGLTAPLSNTTLDLLEQATVGLRKLRLCGNNLKKGDKDQVVDLWRMKWGGKAVEHVERSSCMLGVAEEG
ncbi:tonsoku-like protein [Branchiostoma floridae x Branchiostoma japonicum]